MKESNDIIFIITYYNSGQIMKNLITVKEYAYKHNKSISTIYNQIKSGKLKTQNQNGQIYIIDNTPNTPNKKSKTPKNNLKRKIKRLKEKLDKCQEVIIRQSDQIHNLSVQVSDIAKLSIIPQLQEKPKDTIDITPITKKKKKDRKKSKNKKGK